MLSRYICVCFPDERDCQTLKRAFSKLSHFPEHNPHCTQHRKLLVLKVNKFSNIFPQSFSVAEFIQLDRNNGEQ